MTSIKRSALPKYVTVFRDRHRKLRYRGRRRGWPTHYFRAAPGTETFSEEYQRWLDGETPRVSIGEQRTIPRSVSALVALFYRRNSWAELKPSTRATYRGWFEAFRVAHGHRLWPDLTPNLVRRLMETKVGAPAAANNILRMLKMLGAVAKEEGWRKDNPTDGVKASQSKAMDSPMG